jgi:hypothetical protein
MSTRSTPPTSELKPLTPLATPPTAGPLVQGASAAAGPHAIASGVRVRRASCAAASAPRCASAPTPICPAARLRERAGTHPCGCVGAHMGGCADAQLPSWEVGR